MAKTFNKQHYLGGDTTKRRFWLQDWELSDYEWKPGRRYDRTITRGMITIKANPSGKYVISRKGKTGRFSEMPVLDIQNDELTKMFEGCTALNIEVNSNSIVVRQSDLDIKIQEREQSFIETVSAGKPLKWGSFFHGGGVIDSALHSGMNTVGVDSNVSVAVELIPEYLSSSLRNNTFWSEDALAVNSPVELLMQGKSPTRKVHAISMGIPCTGASKSGKSKLKLKHAEDHESAGSMFVYALQYILFANPSVVVIENVREYSTTSSWSVIRACLTHMGYVLNYRELNGNEFGALEDRTRMCAVAVSRGLNDLLEFDIDAILPTHKKPDHLCDVIEDVPLDSPEWKRYDYLKEKAIRDQAKGNSFSNQFLDPKAATKVGVSGKGYSKARSTEPFIKHPTDPDLLRLMRVSEHAAVKSIPLSVVAGNSNTRAHEILGQSVIYYCFEAVGEYIGQWAKRLVMALKSPQFELSFAA